MNGIFSAVGVALTAAVFALLLKKDVPGIAFLMTLAAGLLIFTLAIHGLQRIAGSLENVMRIAGIEQSLYLPVIKAVGIAAVVRIAASLCRDAGQSSLATKLELVGAVSAMAVTLPLLTRVLNLVSSMIA